MGRRHGVGRSGSAAWSRGPAGPGRRGSACPGRATAVSSSTRRSAGSTGGYAGLFDPSARPDRGRLLRRRLRRPPRIGARLVQRRHCSPTAGRTRRSPRTTASRRPTALKVKASRRRPDPGPRGGPHPAQRVGRRRSRGRRRPRTTPTRRRSPSPARSPSGPVHDGLRAVWADAARQVGAYQPPARGRADVGGRRRPRTRPRPSTAARLARPARPARGTTGDVVRRPVADVGRPRHGPGRCSTRARPRGPIRRGRRGGRGLAAAAGRPRRDARLAVRPGDRAARRTPRTILDERAAIATAAAAAGLTAPDTLRTAFESPDGFASATLEATAELEAIAALRRRRGGTARRVRPARPDAGPVGDDARGGARPAPGPCSRPVTWPGRRRRPDRGAVGLDGRRRGRTEPGRQPRHLPARPRHRGRRWPSPGYAGVVDEARVTMTAGDTGI